MRRGAISVWTIVQVVSILIWILGFVIAFYYVQSFVKPSWLRPSWLGTTTKAIAQNGQLAGLILTGLAYLVVIYSMIQHSPDRRGDDE
jgi:hypothetical protein